MRTGQPSPNILTKTCLRPRAGSGNAISHGRDRCARPLETRILGTSGSAVNFPAPGRSGSVLGPDRSHAGQSRSSTRHPSRSPAWNGTSSTALPAASLPCRRGGTTWLSRTSVIRCLLTGRP
jgi:hypothetical protein